MRSLIAEGWREIVDWNTVLSTIAIIVFVVLMMRGSGLTIDGFQEFYGRSVFHCSYCDGWALRDQPLAIRRRGEHGKGLALEMTAWSSQPFLCIDGASDLTGHDVERLRRHGIAWT